MATTFSTGDRVEGRRSGRSGTVVRLVGGPEDAPMAEVRWDNDLSHNDRTAIYLHALLRAES